MSDADTVAAPNTHTTPYNTDTHTDRNRDTNAVGSCCHADPLAYSTVDPNADSNASAYSNSHAYCYTSSASP
jgi:hypothetical protein